MYKKTMREALIEARAYRDPIDEGITGNIQKAITIAKKMSGNMTAAVKEIEKIAKGLSDEPSVRVALRTANEELEEATPVPPRDLMLTYGKPGEKVKAYYTKFMQDLQNKASELRKKGFVVDKMGRTQPMSKLRDTIPEELEEKMKLKYDKGKEGWYDEKGRRRYLSIGATNAIMRKKLDHAMKTGDWTDFNKEEVSYEETV
jgi:hypothetical protein|tara:strand:+ start:480 stop:1085 length:606 start_codon:yes stop_codon:yes gene_type:complete